MVMIWQLPLVQSLQPFLHRHLKLALANAANGGWVVVVVVVKLIVIIAPTVIDHSTIEHHLQTGAMNRTDRTSTLATARDNFALIGVT